MLWCLDDLKNVDAPAVPIWCANRLAAWQGAGGAFRE